MHKIIKADSFELLKERNKERKDKGIEHGEFDVILTDPPYGIGNDAGTGNGWDNIKDYSSYLKELFELGFSELKENGLMIMFMSEKNLKDIILAADGYKFEIGFWQYKNLKCSCSPGNKIFGWSNDLIVSIKKGKKNKLLNNNFLFMKKIYEFTAPQTNYPKNYSYQFKHAKPVILLETMLKDLGIVGDGYKVLDPFAGSGSTLEACNNLGIPCTLIEKFDSSLEIIDKRIERMKIENVEK